MISPLSRTRLSAALLALVCLAPLAPAQKLLDKDLPANDPANDPYTRGGREEFMEKAGYVSMGGFEIGPAPMTTEDIDAMFEDDDDVQFRWIETEHFELGIALEGVKVRQDEKKKVRAECARLGKKLHKVDKKPRFMDPWLRAHLYAQRLEEHYDNIVEFLDAGDIPFPATDSTWVVGEPYWGNGPYLGQNGKFEVLIFPTEFSFATFMRNKVGLTTRQTQRWNFIERDTLTIITHIEQEEMRVDQALHGHMVSSATQNLLNGFKHYSYDKPVWVLEGCCHWFERDLNPRFNSSTSSEGGAPVKIRKERWAPEVAKMISSGKAPAFATLVRRKAFAELTKEDHLALYSMVDYLRTEHPGFLAKYFRRISGLKNADNIDDPAGLEEEQRQTFQEELGMNYAQFDAAWREWASEPKNSEDFGD